MAFGHPNLEVYSLHIVFTVSDGNLTYKAAVISIQTSQHCCLAIFKIHPLIREQLIMLKSK